MGESERRRLEGRVLSHGCNDFNDEAGMRPPLNSHSGIGIISADVYLCMCSLLQ